MSILPKDIYGKIIKYSSPIDRRSLIVASKLAFEWAQDNRNWFQLIDNHSNNYDENANYRNFYYYLQLLRNFFTEIYNKSNYETRVISLQEYVKSGQIETIDDVKYRLSKKLVTQDEVENFLIDIMKKDNIRFYFEFEKEKYMIDRPKIARMMASDKILNYLIMIDGEDPLPVIIAPNIQYLLKYGDFTYNGKNILNEYPNLLKGLATHKSLKLIFKIYAFLHLFINDNSSQFDILIKTFKDQKIQLDEYNPEESNLHKYIPKINSGLSITLPESKKTMRPDDFYISLIKKFPDSPGVKVADVFKESFVINKFIDLLALNNSFDFNDIKKSNDILVEEIYKSENIRNVFIEEHKLKNFYKSLQLSHPI